MKSQKLSVKIINQTLIYSVAGGGDTISVLNKINLIE